MAEGIPRDIRRAFLARHGGRARPIQERAWHGLDPARDGVVIAPTGSGKTEAAFMPVAGRLLQDSGGAGSLRTLVVSPTRPLASDLYDRLAPILRELGLRLDVATSDRNSVGAVQSDVLIRTPEGIDSVLCRSPAQLRHLKTVVVDEVHAFLGDPRGTQLVGLLVRLERLQPGLRRIGISATVDDPDDLSRFRLLKDPVVIEGDADDSDTRLHYYSWLGDPDRAARDFVNTLRRLGVRKALAFVGSRARAEEMCAALDCGPLRGYCLVHHAGLSTSLRREAEARFRSAPVGVMVATSTMEVGVDIGTVDTCILFDAPRTPASYKQRIGRAGRRHGRRSVIVVTGLYDRRISFAQAIGALNSGKPKDLRPCGSAVVQQFLSHLTQHRGGTLSALSEFADSAYGLAAPSVEAIISHLEQSNWLCRNGEDDEIHLTSRSTALLESHQLHLTFSGAGGAAIRDERTGQYLGRAVAREGEAVRLGGMGREITGIDLATGAAYSRPTQKGKASFASAGRSPFQALAPQVELLTGGRCQPC